MSNGERGDSKKGGFTVNDRRSFADDTAGTPTGEVPAAGDQTDKSPAPPAGEKTARDAGMLPAVDFHTFVLSLGSSTLLNLGELEDPEAGAAERDLPMAKHTIDILAMLKEKTKGNLTAAEDKLMESLLFDLRLRYVEATKS